MHIFMNVPGVDVFKAVKGWCITFGRPISVDDVPVTLRMLRNFPLVTRGGDGGKEILVFLVDNCGFPLLAVCYDQRELDEFTNPFGPSTVEAYYLPKDLVLKYVGVKHKEVIENL